MQDSIEVRTIIRQLLESQKLATLATQSAESPYCNIVAFSHSGDLKTLYFATPRTTKKYGNLQHNPNVSVLIDNRESLGGDFTTGLAVTAIGRVTELFPPADADCRRLHADRHTSIADFILSPDCALMQIVIEQYIVVRNISETAVYETSSRPGA